MSDFDAVQIPGGASLVATPSRPAKAVRIDLAADSSVADAFITLVRACFSQMEANEAGLLAGRNPEFLHQFRVGLRRLRSAFRAFRPVLEAEHYAAMKAELSWLSGVLGPARDWDVLLAETIVPLARSHPVAAGLASFRRRCAEQRRTHAEAARQAIESPRYASLKLQLEHVESAPQWSGAESARRLLALPLKEFAALRLARRGKSARRLAKEMETADAAGRHRLRIAAKKLRYAIEFFQSLFDRAQARAYAGALADMQDALGLLNDCATGRRLAASVAAGRDAAADALVRGLVAGWIAAREQHGLAALAAGRKTWRAQKRFWKSALPRDNAEADNAC